MCLLVDNLYVLPPCGELDFTAMSPRGELNLPALLLRGEQTISSWRVSLYPIEGPNLLLMDIFLVSGCQSYN